MVEHLKHEGTSHSSSDLLKMWASWSAQVFRRLCNTVWAWCFSSLLPPEDLMHIIFTDLKCRGGGLLEVLMVVKRDGQKGCGFQKSTVKFIRIFSKIFD